MATSKSKAAPAKKPAAAKTTAKKTATAKAPAAKKAAVKKVAVAKKPAAKKPAAPRAKKGSPTPEERYRMVQEAAYFIAEKDAFSGCSTDYWITAEAQIELMLKGK